MKTQLWRLCMSFFYAGRGIWYCVRSERNFRLHLVAGSITLWLGSLLQTPRGEFALLILCVGGVLTMELLNTAAESLTDLCAPNRHPLARIAKDTAAGAVLVSAVTAAAVGLPILWQPERLLALSRHALQTPSVLIALAALGVFAVWFVFFSGRPKQ